MEKKEMEDFFQKLKKKKIAIFIEQKSKINNKKDEMTEINSFHRKIKFQKY